MARPDWLTVPNLITVLRLVLLVPVCYLVATRVQGLLPVVLVVLWGGTDWVDGAIARRFNQESNLGRILDPIADRAGILAVTVAVVVAGIFPWSLIAVIAVVDLVVAAVAGRAVMVGTVRVAWLGKVRSAVLFVALGMAVLSIAMVTVLAPVALGMMIVGVALHAVAGLQYCWTARRAIRSGDANADPRADPNADPDPPREVLERSTP